MEIAEALFYPPAIKSFKNAQPNKLYLGTFSGKTAIDKCMAVYFKQPNSYTGEDIVELHCHGGARLAQAILQDLLDNGATLAENGEFTRRAFFNNKLSLDCAEGVLEMINAESLSQIKGAFRLQEGHLKTRIMDMTDKLITAIAELEVGLDNPYEYETEAYKKAYPTITFLYDEIKKLLDCSYASQYIKEGIHVAIIGQANRGKSSLLNSITKSNRAIVTDIAGTTRDTLDESIEYKGIKIVFTDTAGMRDTTDTIESIGIERAVKSAISCDIIILLCDAKGGIDEYDIDIINLFSDKSIIIAYNKCDLIENNCNAINDKEIKKCENVCYTINNNDIEAKQYDSNALRKDIEAKQYAANDRDNKIKCEAGVYDNSKSHLSGDNAENAIYISAKYNINIERLLDKILDIAKLNNVDSSGEIFLTKRHMQALNQARDVLDRVKEYYNSIPIDCLLVDLNELVMILGSIDGSRVSDSVVDTVFKKFCVGK